MNTTIPIILVLLGVAVAILVKLKKLSGESVPEPESNISRELGVPGKSEQPVDSEVHNESGVPKRIKKLVERARDIQQKYWTPNRDEKKRLLMNGIDDLAWDKALRLLHLTCLEMHSDGPCREQFLDEELALEASLDDPPGGNRDLIVRLVTRLL